MTSRNHHFTDEELLRALDGELKPRSAGRLHEHLSTCAECRTRMEAIRATVAELDQLHHAELDGVLPETSRRNLQVRISHAMHNYEPAPHTIGHWRVSAAWSVAAILLACTLTAGLVRRMELRKMRVNIVQTSNPALPDRNLTPGSYHNVRVEEVCAAKAYQQSRVTSAALKREVLREYGMSDQAAANHEIDYLVIPELGGTDDLRNLWPEPYDSTVWNAHVKDELEEYLHQMVCEQKLDIGVAQRDIATDWISAYKKYFRTDTPVRANS